MPEKMHINNIPISAISDNAAGILSEPLIMASDYLSLVELISQSDLKPLEQEFVLYVLNYAMQCDHCLAIHQDEIEGNQLPEAIIQSLHEGVPLSDTRLRALQEFLHALLAQKGQMPSAHIAAFLAVGFSQKNVMELTTAFSMKAIGNYARHIPETPDATAKFARL